MIKVEVIEKFTLKRFNELKNIERINDGTDGYLYVGDRFECTEELASYLTGNNPLKKIVVKIIEVKPKEEIPKEVKDNVKEVIDNQIAKVEEKPKKKKTSKK